MCCLDRLELPFWVTDLFPLYNWSDKMPKGVQMHPHNRTVGVCVCASVCLCVCLCGLQDASALSRTELGKSKIIVSGGFTSKGKRRRTTRIKLEFDIIFYHRPNVLLNSYGLADIKTPFFLVHGYILYASAWQRWGESIILSITRSQRELSR